MNRNFRYSWTSRIFSAKQVASEIARRRSRTRNDAARVFRDTYRLLEGPAERFFEDAFEPPPHSSERPANLLPIS